MVSVGAAVVGGCVVEVGARVVLVTVGACVLSVGANVDDVTVGAFVYFLPS